MPLRKLLRAAGVVVLVSVATCTDLTNPRGGQGVRVSIAPTFSKAATFAKAVYAAAGIQFDRVRVVIVQGQTEVLKDTTVAYTPTSAELTLPLLITAPVGELVTVTLEYRNADIVMYSGTSSVATVAVGSPAPAPTPVVIVPVGPGSTAVSVSISPSSGSFPTSAPVPFTAQALTSDNTPIAGAVFGWTVDDATVASVNAQGVVAPTSKGGVVKVRATTLNEKFAEASIRFVTPPAAIKLESGGGQTVANLDVLPAPVVVKVVDANGVALPGIQVAFGVATGGGSVVAINSLTDADGLARASWTLGDAIVNAEQTMTATVAALPNAPLTITANATERPTVALVFTQQPTNSLMGASITPAVTVRGADDHGRLSKVFAGPVTIALQANPGSATLGGTLTVSGTVGVGVMSFPDLTINAAGKGYTLRATAALNLAVTSSAFDVDQVPAGLSLSAGGNQTAPIKSTLSQIAVKVADANGLGVPGVTVAFAVATGGGSIVVNNGVTDANGLAKATWTLGTTVGQQSITATAGTIAGSPLTITATATPLPAIALAFQQQPLATTTNAAITPAVTVKAIDADGNTVTGFTGNVTVALETPGSATLGGTTTVTAVAGVATFSNLTVNVAGSYKLTAASAPLTPTLSVAFTVSPPPAVALAFQVQPSNVVADSVIKPAVQVKIVDANGATVTSATDAITIDFSGSPNASLHGTKTVAAVNGIAIFSDLSVVPIISGVQLQATATGLSAAISSSFDVTEPPAVARTWNGSLSSRWTDAGNWTPSGVPTVIDSVTIVSAPNVAVIDSASAADAILVQTGGTLRVRSGPGYYVYTPKIYNKGTLELTHAYMASSIANQGTVIVDSVAITPILSNIGASSKLQIVSDHGTGAFFTTGRLTNQGLIEMTDVGNQPAYLAANDSIVNYAGASITSTGGFRDVIGVIRNYGTMSFSTAIGVIFQPTPGVTSLNAGSFTVTGGGYLYQAADSTTVFENTGSMTIDGEWDLLDSHLRSVTGTVGGTGYLKTARSQLELSFSNFHLPINLDDHSRFPGDSVNIPTGGTLTLHGGEVTQKLTIQGTVRPANSSWGFTIFHGGATVRSGGVLDVKNTSGMDSIFTILSGGRLTINASGQDVELDVSKPMSNSGQIELTSSVAAYTARLYVSGTLTNTATGTLGAYGGAGGPRSVVGTLNNQGLVYIEHDSYLDVSAAGVTHTNSGTITIDNAGAPAAAPDNTNSYSLTLTSSSGSTALTNSGTINVGSNRTLLLNANSSITNSSTGVIGGKGTIDQTAAGTSFTNAGKIKPGGNGVVGTMSYRGDFSIGTGGVEIDVSCGIANDLLSVTGNAAVTGLFNVVGSNSGCGTLTILSATGTVTGSATVSPTGFPGGWFIQTNAQSVTMFPNLGAPLQLPDPR